MKPKIIVAIIALTLLFTAGIALYLQKTKDHSQCKDIVEERVDANGDTIISRKHICKPMFDF